MKIQEVIEKLIEWHQPYDNLKTRDSVKCGDPEQECTGIAITCYASAEAVEKSKNAGCNLLISHETCFYGDEFGEECFKDNQVYAKKKRLIEDSGVVIWRDHDHMHGQSEPWGPKRTRNDYIYFGIMKELGWESYVIGDRMKPLWYQLPETTVKELADFLIEKLNLNGVRIIGREKDKVSKVFICEHCMGRGDDKKIMEAETNGADVMIPLEINDWTMSAYVRDAMYFGRTKAIIEMGHFNTEEPGMKYMTEWLPEAVGREIPIVFIQSGDAFQYHLAEKN